MADKMYADRQNKWALIEENKGYLSGKKRLGEMLLAKGLINESQLEAAIRKQKQWGGRLGKNLVNMNYISEITLLKFLGQQLQLPCTDLTKIKFDERIYSRITLEIAKQYHVIPIEKKEDEKNRVLFLAMSDPTNTIVIDEISFLTGYRVKAVIGTESQIGAAIDKYYFDRDWVEIKPLSSKVKILQQEEMAKVHEDLPQERKAYKTTVMEQGVRLELLAMIRLLVKKGLISVSEYKKELSALKKI